MHAGNARIDSEPILASCCVATRVNAQATHCNTRSSIILWTCPNTLVYIVYSLHIKTKYTQSSLIQTSHLRACPSTGGGMRKSITCAINNYWVSQLFIIVYVVIKIRMATAAAGHSKNRKRSVLTLETKLEIVHALEKVTSQWVNNSVWVKMHFVKGVLSYGHIWVTGSPLSQGAQIRADRVYTQL